MARRRKTGLCPCGARKPYLRCCAPFVSGDELPDSPAQLMRSRYTAYALGEVEYVMETTDPDGSAWEEDAQRWRASIEEFTRACEFRGVRVLEEQVEDDRGTVTFRAKLQRGREDNSFEETSEFICRDGRWLYSSGVVASTQT